MRLQIFENLWEQWVRARDKEKKEKFDLPCGFSKNVFSKERVKPWFFANFKIILRHIFPENFIEFPPVVQKI